MIEITVSEGEKTVLKLNQSKCFEIAKILGGQ